MQTSPSSAAPLRRAIPYIVTIAAGIYLWTISGHLETGMSQGRLGPDVWPRLIACLMILAAGIGIVQAWCGADGPVLTERLVTEEADSAENADGRGRWRLAAGISAMAMFPALVPLLGFLPTTAAVLFAQIWVGGYRRPVVTSVIAVLGAFCLFIMFQRFVYLSLPLGVGPFETFSTAAMAVIGVR